VLIFEILGLRLVLFNDLNLRTVRYMGPRIHRLRIISSPRVGNRARMEQGVKILAPLEGQHACLLLGQHWVSVRWKSRLLYLF